jgi:hypothetical protein
LLIKKEEEEEEEKKEFYHAITIKRVMCQEIPQKNNIHLALTYCTSVRSPQNKGRN